jgi:hypothetical protein
MGFWQAHGYIGGLFFVLALLFVPRITILFGVTLSAIVVETLIRPYALNDFFVVLLVTIITPVAWTMWLVMPRYLIAIVAMLLYYDTNPVMALVAWIIAFPVTITQYALISTFVKHIRENGFASWRNFEWKEFIKWEWSKTTITLEPTPTKEYRWWKVLGVKKDASSKEIWDGYRNALKDSHPDSGGSNADPSRIKEIKTAFEQAKKQGRVDPA